MNNENPWWAYPSEIVWKDTADGGCIVTVVSSSRLLGQFDVGFAGKIVSVIWDPKIAALTPRDGEPLPKPLHAKVRAFIERASEPEGIDGGSQWVVDRVAKDLAHDPLVPLKTIRQHLMRTYAIELDAAQRIVERLQPRFVLIRGDYLAIQPLGLLRSQRREEVLTILRVALDHMWRAYDADANVSSFSVTEAFGEVDDVRSRMVLRVLQAFRLSYDGNDRGGTWYPPSDNEELWSDNVRTPEDLWRFAPKHQRVKRPWPGAIERSEWDKNRLEFFLEQVTKDQMEHKSVSPETYCKILFLGANPLATQRLELDVEARTIREKLTQSALRDSFDFETRWALRPDDLLQYLNEEHPTIVHFSGHGDGILGIVLQDDSGAPQYVSGDALKHLFTVLKDDIRVVVLNACFSIEQAAAIVEVIDCVVGMKASVGDEAARMFAVSFYRALGFGRSVKNAFEQGVAALKLHGVGDDDIPELLVRDGIDPDKVILVSTPPSAGG